MADWEPLSRQIAETLHPEWSPPDFERSVRRFRGQTKLPGLRLGPNQARESSLRALVDARSDSAHPGATRVLGTSASRRLAVGSGFSRVFLRMQSRDCPIAELPEVVESVIHSSAPISGEISIRIEKGPPPRLRSSSADETLREGLCGITLDGDSLFYQAGERWAAFDRTHDVVGFAKHWLPRALLGFEYVRLTTWKYQGRG